MSLNLHPKPKPLPPSPEQRADRLFKENRDLIAVQDVLVAAGLVSREKIDQAHEIVKIFK